MSTTLNKLEYLDETKQQIKTALNTNFNSQITDSDTFRSYVSKINNIYTNWPKVTGENTSLTLNNTKKGKLTTTLKGNTSQDTTTGKNITNIDIYLGGSVNNTTGAVSLNSGISSFTNTNGVITFTTTAEYRGTYSEIIEVKPTTTYTLSYNKLTSGITYYATIYWYDDNQTFISREAIYDTKTSPANAKYSRLFIYISSIGTASIKEIQLELGSTATDYEKYTGGIPAPNPSYPEDVNVVSGNNTIIIGDGTNSTNYSINLPSGMELCKIGTYQDYFYKDSGKWYLHKEIGKWQIPNNAGGYNSSNNWYYLGFSNFDNIKTDFTTGFCNYLTLYVSDFATDTTKIGFSRNGTTHLVIRNTNCLDQSAYRTWFTNNDIYVYIPLATPTNTEITDNTLIGQLDTIMYSYDTQTNITQTNADIPFIISTSALKKGGN